MSFLDLYQGDQDQAARIQPNEGADLPSGFTENFNAAWSDGQLFSQSIARGNARASVLGDYIDEIRQKTGNDLIDRSAKLLLAGDDASDVGVQRRDIDDLASVLVLDIGGDRDVVVI